MTDRAEIERLLNQTGRTLEGTERHKPIVDCVNAFNERGGGVASVGNALLHQSDVIELLVGALRDALNERDAAIKDIPRACDYCKHWNDSPVIEKTEYGSFVVYCGKECHNISGVNTGWEWQGVKKNGG